MTIERVGIHHSVNEVFPPRELHRYLEDRVHDVTVADGQLDEPSGVDALVTLDYHDEFLEHALVWIHSIQAGVDRFPLEKLRAHNIALTSSHGIHGICVAETVLGYMLVFAHAFDILFHQQSEHDWKRPPWHRPFTLVNETVCVVGTGALGESIAAYSQSFDMRVIGVNKRGIEVAGFDRVHSTDDLHAGLSSAKFVVIAIPLTNRTKGLIGTPELDRVGPDSYLINVARGAVLDEGALNQALKQGTIAGAAIDVAETEPLPARSPLWDRSNLILTPHIAGVWNGYYEKVGEIVVSNLERFNRGESLHNREV